MGKKNKGKGRLVVEQTQDIDKFNEKQDKILQEKKAQE
jgi:hypothetical protein